MPRLPVLTPRQVVSLLVERGFVCIRQRGSHLQFRHADGVFMIIFKRLSKAAKYVRDSRILLLLNILFAAYLFSMWPDAQIGESGVQLMRGHWDFDATNHGTEFRIEVGYQAKRPEQPGVK